MQIQARSIDDFKTERKDITPPLPAMMRLVPILFYFSIAAAILLNALFIARASQANKLKDTLVKEEKQVAAELESAKVERKNLETEAKKATDIAAWIDATRPLQPLVVEIARSLKPEASLLELRLDRDGENPAQVKLSLRLQTNNSQQLDETLQTIANTRFRTYSPQQTIGKGEIDYKATLLWQDGNREATPITQ